MIARRALLVALLVASLDGLSSWVAAPAVSRVGVAFAATTSHPDAVEIKSRSGSLGRLARVVVDDGASYVPADRLASLLKGSWSAKGARGTLTVGKKSA